MPPKNHKLQIRLTTEEHGRVFRKAAMAGLDMSNFVRLLIFNSEVSVMTKDAQPFLNKKPKKKLV